MFLYKCSIRRMLALAKIFGKGALKEIE